MRNAFVEVTSEDITHGKRFDCGECPIARAVLRLFPGASEVSASPTHIELFHDKEGDLRGMTPPEAELFMRRFDCGYQVSPFSFQIMLHRTP